MNKAWLLPPFDRYLASLLGALTSGQITFALPPNAEDDAAAARLGVPIGGVYRNGSVLMVRVT